MVGNDETENELLCLRTVNKVKKASWFDSDWIINVTVERDIDRRHMFSSAEGFRPRAAFGLTDASRHRINNEQTIWLIHLQPSILLRQLAQTLPP